MCATMSHVHWIAACDMQVLLDACVQPGPEQIPSYSTPCRCREMSSRQDVRRQNETFVIRSKTDEGPRMGYAKLVSR